MSNLPLRGDGSPRTVEIQRAVKQNEEKMVRETIILQKVNKAHREAFKEKFPGQVEHVMRLTAERLQGLITKKPIDLTDTNSWAGTAEEIKNLCEGLYYLSLINKQFPVQGE